MRGVDVPLHHLFFFVCLPRVCFWITGYWLQLQNTHSWLASAWDQFPRDQAHGVGTGTLERRWGWDGGVFDGFLAPLARPLKGR